jgi:hypothetical protein
MFSAERMLFAAAAVIAVVAAVLGGIAISGNHPRSPFETRPTAADAQLARVDGALQTLAVPSEVTSCNPHGTRAQNTSVCWDSPHNPAASMEAFIQALAKVGADDIAARCVRTTNGEYCKGSARLYGQTIQIAVLPSSIVAVPKQVGGGRLYANAIVPVPLVALPLGTPISVQK